MSFRHPDAATIENLLRQTRTIAVLGWSVNPAETAILRERCWPTLDAAVSSLQDGVSDATAAARAPAAGVVTIMDRCIFRDRALLS